MRNTIYIMFCLQFFGCRQADDRQKIDIVKENIQQNDSSEVLIYATQVIAEYQRTDSLQVPVPFISFNLDIVNKTSDSIFLPFRRLSSFPEEKSNLYYSFPNSDSIISLDILNMFGGNLVYLSPHDSIKYLGHLLPSDVIELFKSSNSKHFAMFMEKTIKQSRFHYVSDTSDLKFSENKNFRLPKLVKIVKRETFKVTYNDTTIFINEK
jgi:hypothetical protein